ncbi:hypothetical protein JCM8202_002265 [Rhodotorula sphaerocarpa]
MAEFSYDDLIADETFGFNPSPAFQIPVLPTASPYVSQPPNRSGASTPTRGGRGSAGSRGGASNRGNRGRGGANSPASYPDSGRDSPSFSGRGGARGRGAGSGFGHSGLGAFSALTRGGGGGGGRGGRGGSGTASPRGGFAGGRGGFNPLLVPVKFVPASTPGLGTVGGEDEHGLEKAGAEVLPAHPDDAQLAAQVGKIDLEAGQQAPAAEHPDYAVPETAFEPEPETTATMALDELEDAPAPQPQSSRHPGLGSRKADAPTSAATEPVNVAPARDAPPTEEEPPLFEISVDRTEVVLDESIAPPEAFTIHQIDERDVLAVSADDDTDSDSDSDDEQIVYPRRAVSHADPVYSNFAADKPAAPVEPTNVDFASLPQEAARPAPESARPTHPSLPKQPAAKSKKALKRESRAARKAGKAHTRSGNGHLGGGRTLAETESDDQDAADAAAGAALFARMQGNSGAVDDMLGNDETAEEASDVDETAGGHIDGQPRMDDSDVDWGSASPPPIGLGARARGRAKKHVQRQQRADQRQAEKMERLVAAGSTREEIELALAVEQSLREAEEAAAEQEHKSRAARSRDQERISNDYLANLDIDAEGDDSMAILAAFANGAVGALGGDHERGDDLDRRAAEDEEDSDEWGTSEEDGSDETSSDEDDDEDTADAADRRLAEEEEDDSEEVDSEVELEMDYALGNADGRVEHAMSLASSDDSDDSSLSSSTDSDVELYAFETALMSGGKIQLSSIGQSGGGGRKAERARRKERRRERKGKMRAFAEEDDDDDSSDEAEMFGGGDTWADQDEDYIARLQNVVRANADLLETAKGGRDARRANRRERNKLFKAISNGAFDDVDFHDDMDDLDDEMANAMFAHEEERAMGGGSSRKQRKKDKSFGGAFSASLADQWEQDRKTKAQKKAERAATRAAAREANTRDSYRSKGKGGKKAKAAREADSQSNDAATINTQIVRFIQFDIGQSSMALPPMSKKARIAVHLLAEAYGLKSRSMGKGNSRFPVLERTSRTTVQVNDRKVRAIIGTADGEDELGMGYGGRPRGGKMSGLWKALEGASGKRSGGGSGARGGTVGRNSEGTVVGQGADKLGTENIGFALLKKMGWTEGGQIGLSGGLHEPVAARVKTTRQGLGSGYSVTQREAYGMARAPDTE